MTDSQYHSFRSNLPYLAALLIIHPLCRKAWNKFYKPLPPGKTVFDTAQARLEQRASFDYSFALIFLAGLHGFSMFKVLAILWINYNLATSLPRRCIPAATWIFNVGVLFLNELCDGYKYRDLGALLSGTSPYLLRTARIDSSLAAWGAWLDSWGGIMSRWEILFNITVLRLISFNLDYYWSLDYRSSSPVEVGTMRDTRLYRTKLTTLRRNNSTQRPSPNAIVFPFPRKRGTLPSGTTSPTLSTRRSTSPARSSPSTITSRNSAISPSRSKSPAPSATPCAFYSASSAWK